MLHVLPLLLCTNFSQFATFLSIKSAQNLARALWRGSEGNNGALWLQTSSMY
ncbi:hypothetical protein HanXRQr2_Chr10g0452221 [Helianthus annuus]|uniref:Uncharacterized protein n=1 Tax=Helianthus annuus TaxID=4232 RepID=A0A9K3HZK4_HELAN|nr:hypothetical protein HanXRQr2_Chr10g0452221 [Helianthus annuus]